MKVSYVKKHVMALAGDTSGRHKLELEFLTDYINWAVQEILERVRKGGKDYQFLRGTTTLTDDGTGDYALPSDFGSIARVSGSSSDSVVHNYDGVPNDKFFEASDAALGDRNFYSVYYNNTTRVWRIRFYTPSSVTISTYTVDYKKRQPRLVDDQDDISIFPNDEGWEQVVIYATAIHAYRFSQENFSFDPRPEYESLVEQRIAALNADTPDEQVYVKISEHDKFYKRLEEDRYGDSGGMYYGGGGGR